MVKTKIIATMGPACQKQAVMRKMIEKGLDFVRFNFSHGTHVQHKKNNDLVRILNAKMHRAIKVIQDLEGFRIRVGELKSPIEIKKNQYLIFTQESIIGEKTRIPFDYQGSLTSFKKGTLIYVDDGRLILEVCERYKKSLKLKSHVNWILKSHKGINISGVKLEFDSMTEKDKNNIIFGKELGVDYVAQSFVRNAADIKQIKDLLSKCNSRAKVIAKIENQQALEHIDEIIDISDGIMVARGDLGICVPIYQVPMIQKQIVAKCNKKKRFVIVATQMLESMTENMIPTRAEVSDVANAILDGADAVMLSGETAVGAHPDKVVDMMNQIIMYTEKQR